MNRRLFGFSISALLSAALASVDGRGAAPSGRYTLTATTAYDTKTKLTWQRVAAPSRMVFADALPYCNNHFGAPWRMPTYKELFTSVDLNATASPLFDTTAFSYDPNNTYVTFWSSTTPDASNAMTIVFSSGGGSGPNSKTTFMNNLRCVH